MSALSSSSTILSADSMLRHTFPKINIKAAREYKRLGYNSYKDVPFYMKYIELILIPIDDKLVEPLSDSSSCVKTTVAVAAIATGAFIGMKGLKGLSAAAKGGEAVFAVANQPARVVKAFEIPPGIEHFMPHPIIHYPEYHPEPPIAVPHVPDPTDQISTIIGGMVGGPIISGILSGDK